MNQHLDISYVPGADDRLHRFDLHVPPHFSKDSSAIIFVHGGAWRGEDKADHQAMAHQLAAASNSPVLVPNYHLTTNTNKLIHPGHAEDILRFLEFLTTWDGIPDVFDPKGRGLYLVGHSAGAHILSSIFLDSSVATPSLTPSPALLHAAKGVVLSEGIYDIDLLLARFPTYRAWFIASAFGDLPSYADAATTTLPMRKDAAHLRWLVVHSTGDTLVDMPQSDAIYEHLRVLYRDAQVARNVDQLDMEHSDVLLAPVFIEAVSAFAAQ
ncbi:Alpha/Beta hydrolase protein [Mycena vitilis]|nr:Alpha/Beta hydrolase protein [Mycena vitilis]